MLCLYPLVDAVPHHTFTGRARMVAFVMIGIYNIVAYVYQMATAAQLRCELHIPELRVEGHVVLILVNTIRIKGST